MCVFIRNTERGLGERLDTAERLQKEEQRQRTMLGE